MTELPVLSADAEMAKAADRNDADYNASATFSAEDAREALERTADFLAEVERLIAPPGEA